MAKFPPQLPYIFIDQLTEPGDVVLDAMMGSGTALVEAATLGRRGLGFDIDPLAVRINQAKTMLNTCDLNDEKCDVVGQSRRLVQNTDLVESAIQSRFDDDKKNSSTTGFCLILSGSL